MLDSWEGSLAKTVTNEKWCETLCFHEYVDLSGQLKSHMTMAVPLKLWQCRERGNGPAN